MKNKKIINTIFVLFVLFSTNLLAAQNDFFIKGKKLFEKKDLDKSKVFFERDLVFNPKSEKSYLYLAKIFNSEENEKEEEKNLDTTLLLDPENEEAMYMLINYEIKKSNYSEVKELKEAFITICKSLCDKKGKIEESLKDIEPKNGS